AVGVNVTAIWHDAPTATVDPQLFTVAKSPLAEMLETASAPVPMLVNDMNCGGDVVEIVCVPKPSVPGKRGRPEPAPRGAIVRGLAAAVVAAVRAVVDTVSVERTGLAPGVTVGGLNVQVVCGGRLPLAQLRVISVLYAPFCGVMVTTCVLLAPGGGGAPGWGTVSGEVSVVRGE